MRMPELLGKAKLGKGNDYPHDIITKPSTPEFEAAHERVFGKREPAWMRKADDNDPLPCACGSDLRFCSCCED